jgi:hypothetical protein
MADRYLFVPSIGAILVLLALPATWFPASRHKQLAVCTALMLMVILYAAWSYKRTEVWCGNTTPLDGRPHPDLSLCASFLCRQTSDPGVTAANPDARARYASPKSWYMGERSSCLPPAIFVRAP